MARLADPYRSVEEAIRGCSNRLFIAYSGGSDSECLLQLVAQIDHPNAVICHFNHAWSELSEQWELQARARAQSLRMPIVVGRDPAPTHSEEGARQARYSWFESLLDPGDVLLLAHHAQDQLETRWMRLTQSRPPRGMPVTRRLGQGRLVRPLLEHQVQHNPDAVQDPANRDARYRRVQVRQVMAQSPSSLIATLARVGRLYDRLEALVHQHLPASGRYRLDLSLSQASQIHAINAWIWKTARLPAPPQARIQTLLRQIPPTPDRQPAIQWDTPWGRVALRFYRQDLYLEPAVWSAPLPRGDWRPIGVGERARLHAREIPPWHRAWVWQHINEPNRIRWWYPKVADQGNISLEYIELND